MNTGINWILTISFIVVVVSGWAWIFEVMQNRIKRFTTWKELDRYQWVIAGLTIAGTLTFIGTLIVACIFK
jgi:hypothetical protein